MAVRPTEQGYVVDGHGHPVTVDFGTSQRSGVETWTMTCGSTVVCASTPGGVHARVGEAPRWWAPVSRDVVEERSARLGDLVLAVDALGDDVALVTAACVAVAGAVASAHARGLRFHPRQDPVRVRGLGEWGRTPSGGWTVSGGGVTHTCADPLLLRPEEGAHGPGGEAILRGFFQLRPAGRCEVCALDVAHEYHVAHVSNHRDRRPVPGAWPAARVVGRRHLDGPRPTPQVSRWVRQTTGDGTQWLTELAGSRIPVYGPTIREADVFAAARGEDVPDRYWAAVVREGFFELERVLPPERVRSGLVKRLEPEPVDDVRRWVWSSRERRWVAWGPRNFTVSEEVLEDVGFGVPLRDQELASLVRRAFFEPPPGWVDPPRRDVDQPRGVVPAPVPRPVEPARREPPRDDPPRTAQDGDPVSRRFELLDLASGSETVRKAADGGDDWSSQRFALLELD